jgi:hypothetical protein
MTLDPNLAPSERVAVEQALAYLQRQQYAFSLAVEKYQQALVTEPAGDPAGQLAPLWNQVHLAQKNLDRAQRGLVNLRKSFSCCLHCGYLMTTDPGPCKQPGHRLAWERAGRGGAVPGRRLVVRRVGLVPWAGLAALLGGAVWIVLSTLVELSW